MSSIGNRIMVSIACLAMAGCSSWDLPVHQDSVVMGEEGGSGRVAVVYHPGGSGFPKRTVARLGRELVRRGYVVTVNTASPDLPLDTKSYDALVLVSPVYGGEIRPPVDQFVSTHAPFSVPVFVVLTGMFAKGFYESHDLPMLTKRLSQAGVMLTAAVKVGTTRLPGYNMARIRSLCDSIDATLASD